MALGRLDAATSALPDATILVFGYLRTEAVYSSRIEGTESSLSDLLIHEIRAEEEGDSESDAGEVYAYVRAYNHGVARLKEDFPLSNRLLREMHAVLLEGGRGQDKLPGEFRRSQNWIGGTRPGNASYVPPPHDEVEPAMAALERFIHGAQPDYGAQPDGYSLLVRAGLVHPQFEGIHPFLDGNGRIGRLLIAMQLFDGRYLRSTPLYLSRYIDQHRDTYYDLLQNIRVDGDWELWLDFFLTGVRDTALSGARTAQRLFATHRAIVAQVEANAPRRRGTTVPVLEAFANRLVLSHKVVCGSTGLSAGAVRSVLGELVEKGHLTELTGQARNRLYGYSPLMDILITEEIDVSV